MVIHWSSSHRELRTVSKVSLDAPAMFQRLSNSCLSCSHKGFLGSAGRRDVLGLDRSLLWAGRLRLAGGLSRLHDLHIRLDRQLVSKGIACRVDPMRRVIARRAGDGRKPSLDWPSTCSDVAQHLVGAGQLTAKTGFSTAEARCKVGGLTVGRRTLQE
jgi:hypothetical protein